MDKIDPKAAALVIQESAERRDHRRRRLRRLSGRARARTAQNVVENVKTSQPPAAAPACPSSTVWYIVEAGAPGLKQNAPLFQGVKEANALVRGTWGQPPQKGLEPKGGDHHRREDADERLLQHELDICCASRARRRMIITGAWKRTCRSSTPHATLAMGLPCSRRLGRHLDDR